MQHVVTVLAACVQTLCALVSHDDAKQQWLQSTGILALLQRLAMQEPASTAAHPVLTSLGEDTPLGIWRQSARIIAMISADASSQAMIRSVSHCAARMHAACLQTDKLLASTCFSFVAASGMHVSSWCERKMAQASA